MVKTASTLVLFGPGMRPRSRGVLELVTESFARLTDADPVGSVRFSGYAAPSEVPADWPTGRYARYEADFEVA